MAPTGPGHCGSATKGKMLDIRHTGRTNATNVHGVTQQHSTQIHCSSEERGATVVGGTWRVHENDGLTGTWFVKVHVLRPSDSPAGKRERQCGKKC